MATPFSIYIQALRVNRGVGVAETSSYGALETLLNSVGAKLKPSAVSCILHPKNKGKGIPDGGLFTREQLQPLGRDFEPQSAFKQSPARGVVEVKATKDNLQTLVDGEQVGKYLADHGKVLCTNYYQFAVVELRDGVRHTLERFDLAPTEAEFWAATNNVVTLEEKQGASLQAFLERALLYGAPFASPEAVAGFMASCAREAKVRVERADVEALARVRGALETALDVSFHGNDKAEAFFRSSLVQTLFYGVFSAWVLWCRQNPPSANARFDWRLSAHLLSVPVISALFHEFSNPTTVRSLDLTQPLGWVEEMLNNVARAEFEQRFSDDGAVQYFYEPFLQAFDPDLRKQLGVWYTPTSIVRYMVERVDAVLKTELNIAGGLANPRVVVLDPCCGTGAFLVEVIRHIARSLEQDDALGGEDLRAAVMSRVFGFELLTAPFIVAHLQLGLELRALGVNLGEGERAPVFLTNALTGWNKPGPQDLQIAALQDESEKASHVKNERQILVVLGNPPYDGYAGVAIDEERELSEAYRETVAPELAAPEGQGLNELYVRFFRMAERKITEGSGEGIVCYISNYSWLEGKSHTAMREAYLRRFSHIWIDNLHGDRKIGEYAPDGRSSETVFAVRGSSVGIRVGTAIATLARKAGKAANSKATLSYRDVNESRADERRAALIESVKLPDISHLYQELESEVVLGLPFKPANLRADYRTWKRLPELFPTSFPGVKTSRDEAVIDVDRDRLETRMRAYFNAEVSDAEMSQIASAMMRDAPRFEAKKARRTLIERGFLPANIARYCYRPFDVRWLYWEPETRLLDRNRLECKPHIFEGNPFLFTTARTRKANVEPSFTTELAVDLNLMDSGARGFPLYLRDLNTVGMFADQGHFATTPNLTAFARAYLESLGLPDGAEALFYHALAMQHAPRYRAENADALRLDWPRIPLAALPEDLIDEPEPIDADRGPTDEDEDEWEIYLGQQAKLQTARAALQDSAGLGRTIAQLLDVLQSVPGVTESVRTELKVLGVVRKTDGGNLDKTKGDFGVTAGWGYRSNGSVMAKEGRAIERPWTSAEREALGAGAAALGLNLETALAHLGASCFDVYLNDVAYWSGVPSKARFYTMGGYPVLKKWLSYREAEVLGRDLTLAELREVTAMVRRISALLLLEPQLDENYARVVGLS